MSAIKYFKSLGPIVRSDVAEKNCENAIFKLTTRFTVAFLIGSSVLLTAAEFFGKPINCMSSLPKNVINTYCWISSTFTMNDYSFREIGTEAVAPGVMPPESYDDEHIQEKWKFHNYYQWVVFFLCFMAFLCYLPKYIWDTCEGGLLKSVSQNLSQIVYKESEINPRKKVVVEYIMSHLKMHNGYMLKYWLCEFLCFFSIIMQLVMMNSFLDGEFYHYGLKVIDFSEMDQEERVDPMIYVFPRMTKCVFHLFGASGTIERKDAFCLLAQNILNEKVFIVIWIWYIILLTALSILLTYRFLLFALRSLRPRIIYYHTKIIPLETLESIFKKCSVGDWWLFYILATKLNVHIYKDIIMDIAKHLETQASNQPECHNQNPNSGPHSSNGGCSRSMYPMTSARQFYQNAQASAPPSLPYSQSSV